jgi:hypothetical protein
MLLSYFSNVIVTLALSWTSAQAQGFFFLVVFIEVFLSFKEPCLLDTVWNGLLIHSIPQCYQHWYCIKLKKAFKFLLYLWCVECTCKQDVCDTFASAIWWCSCPSVAEQMQCWQVKTPPLRYLSFWHLYNMLCIGQQTAVFFCFWLPSFSQVKNSLNSAQVIHAVLLCMEMVLHFWSILVCPTCQ